MKKCKKCGVEGNFDWDKIHAQNTGKWRLFDNDQERPHECKVAKPAPIPEPDKKCPHPMCDKKIPKTKLQDHVKKEHIDWGDYS